MNAINPKHVPSIGTALIATYMEGYLANHRVILRDTREAFTPEEVVSSGWEFMTWLTALDQVHGRPERFQFIGNILATKNFYRTAFRNRAPREITEWADGFLAAFLRELEADAKAHGEPTDGPVNQERQIFRTYPIVYDPRTNGLDRVDCVATASDAQLGEFPGWIENPSWDHADAMALATMSMTVLLAAENHVSVSDMISLVSTVTLQKAQ